MADPDGPPAPADAREHELTMHVFAVSAGMVAICSVIAYAIF